MQKNWISCYRKREKTLSFAMNYNKSVSFTIECSLKTLFLFLACFHKWKKPSSRKATANMYNSHVSCLVFIFCKSYCFCLILAFSFAFFSEISLPVQLYRIHFFSYRNNKQDPIMRTIQKYCNEIHILEIIKERKRSFVSVKVWWNLFVCDVVLRKIFDTYFFITFLHRKEREW